MVFCSLTPFTKKPERLPDCKTTFGRHNQSRQRSLYMSALNSFPGGFIFDVWKGESSLIWCPKYVTLFFSGLRPSSLCSDKELRFLQICSKFTRDDGWIIWIIQGSELPIARSQMMRSLLIVLLCWVSCKDESVHVIFSWISNNPWEVSRCRSIHLSSWDVHDATVANWVFLSYVYIII